MYKYLTKNETVVRFIVVKLRHNFNITLFEFENLYVLHFFHSLELTGPRSVPEDEM